MLISQKSQYALRAVLELARRYDKEPVKSRIIADSQSIPQRFLENILNQLKQAGIVKSWRGREGGYLLARPPEAISAGDVLRTVIGPIELVDCSARTETGRCVFDNQCAFAGMWEQARDAMMTVYDRTTFAQLLAQDERCMERRPETGDGGAQA
jgi:Rrf2 family transcriptional regulator, cysteine metabolism repressor